MERLAGQVILYHLPFELDAVGAASGHVLPSFESPALRSIVRRHTVRLKGSAPNGYRICSGLRYRQATDALAEQHGDGVGNRRRDTGETGLADAAHRRTAFGDRDIEFQLAVRQPDWAALITARRNMAA